MPSFMLRAFRYRNYRLYFGGQGVSLIGTWLSIVATQWLVYRLAPAKQAAHVLGVAGFASNLPMLVLGPVGGLAADRFNNRNLLLATQACSMAQSALLAFLAFSGLATIPQVIALSALQGLVNAFDMPVRQTFVVRIIEDKDDLPNAIAINSTMFNGARLVGPAMAGLIIARSGTSWCFLVDALSFLAVIGALLAMRVPLQAERPKGRSAVAEIKEGLRYAFGFPPVRAALIMSAAASLSYTSLMTVVPLFAGKLAPAAHLSDDADPGGRLYGYLTAATGCGALVSGIYLAARRSVRGLGRVIGLAPLIMGAGTIVLAWSTGLWTAALGMFAMGLGMLLTYAAMNTVLQTIIDDDKRGRVMSLFNISFIGIAPFGALLGGALAGAWGEAVAATVSGCLAIVAGVVFMARLPNLRKVVRPIYEQKGIPPHP